MLDSKKTIYRRGLLAAQESSPEGVLIGSSCIYFSLSPCKPIHVSSAYSKALYHVLFPHSCLLHWHLTGRMNQRKELLKVYGHLVCTHLANVGHILTSACVSQAYSNKE
jgi:hypothetical protein